MDHEEKVTAQEKAIDLQVRCQENEKTITDLKEQLKNLLTQRQPPSLKMPVYNNLLTELEDISVMSSKNGDPIMQPLIPEIKRTLSTKYQHAQGKVAGLFTNPSYFYNSSSHQLLTSSRDGQEATSSITPDAEDEGATLESKPHKAKLTKT